MEIHRFYQMCISKPILSILLFVVLTSYLTYLFHSFAVIKFLKEIIRLIDKIVF